jgi:DNA-binding PucR family transcriptional regulator
VLALSRSDGRIGLGAVGVGAAGIRRSYGQARALARLQGLPGNTIRVPDVAVYGETGLSELLVQHGNAEHLVAFARRVLGPLIEDSRFGGELIETLQAYLAAGGSPRHAAESMYLHPSTIKYRMRIIRELIGPELLDDHESRFELELALRVHRTLTTMGAVDR